MRVENLVRVKAYPVHTLFPYPLTPAVSHTEFITHLDRKANPRPENADVEMSRNGEFASGKPIDVPHNNVIDGEEGIITTHGGFFNENLPMIKWIKALSESATIGFVAADPEGLLAPWIDTAYCQEPAVAIRMKHQVVDPTNPNTRRSYIWEDNVVDLDITDVPDDGSTQLYCQGFTLLCGIGLDARNEIWTRQGDGWQLTYEQPADGTAEEDLPYYYIDIGIGTATEIKKYIKIHYPYVGSPYIKLSDEPGNTGERIMVIRPSQNLGDKYKNQDYGYSGYNAWNGVASAHGSMIDFRYVGGFIEFSEGGLSRPLIRTEIKSTDEEKCYFIRSVKIHGEGVREGQVAINPHVFPSDFEYVSPVINFGYPHRKDIESIVHYAYPFGYTEEGLPKTLIEPKDGDDPGVATVEYIYEEELRDDNGNIVYEEADPDVPVMVDLGPNQVKFRLKVDHSPTGTYSGKTFTYMSIPVRAVTLKLKETLSETFGSPVELFAEEVQVNQQFNISDLTITSSAQLKFNAFKSLDAVDSRAQPWYWGEFANKNGLIALEIEMMVQFYEPGSYTPYYSSDWTRVFTGYGNARSVAKMEQGGKWYFIMSCVDRDVAMNSPLFYFPWCDGYNIYAFAALCANAGGVKRGSSAGDSDLVFRDYVPENPYLDMGNPEGDEATYFLPVGSGGAPLYRFPGGTTPKAALGTLASQAGYLRYFNVYGKFNIQKFRFQLDNSVPYRTFGIVDNMENDVATDQRAANAVWEGTVTRDYLDIRNSVTLIGLDMFRSNQPNISQQPEVNEENRSVYPPAGAETIWDETAPNYLGFFNRFVSYQNFFFDQEFTDKASLSYYSIMSVPGLDVAFTTWLQPDIYPLHRIGIFDRRTGLFDIMTGTYLELMVCGVSHVVRKGGGSTSMQCRWVPPSMNPREEEA